MSTIFANATCTVIISYVSITTCTPEILEYCWCRISSRRTHNSGAPEDVVHGHPKTKMICKCICIVIDLPHPRRSHNSSAHAQTTFDPYHMSDGFQWQSRSTSFKKTTAFLGKFLQLLSVSPGGRCTYYCRKSNV